MNWIFWCGSQDSQYSYGKQNLDNGFEYSPLGGKGSTMAFVNEVLTPEQKEEFLSWNLKRPIFMAGRILEEIPMFAPFQWTVDKERNMYLLGSSRDPDFPYEFVFLFIWNGKNYLVQFTWVVNGYSRAWSIPENYMIDDVFPYCTEEHFLDDLREALLVYSKSRRENQWPGIQVICNF